MKSFSLEAKVGVFILLGIVLLGYMSTRIGLLDLSGPQGYQVYVNFDSATGLTPDVPVEIAGVQVGRVAGVTLDGDQARVALVLRKEIRLTRDSEATIRTKGILGDRYVELVPGSLSAPRLMPGERIVKSSTPTDVDELLTEMGKIARDIRRVTNTLGGVVGGEEGRESLSSIVKNLREMAEAMNAAVQANTAQAGEIVENLAVFSRTLREAGDQHGGDLGEIMVSARDASARLDRTLAALAEVIDKVNSGQGTLGQLVNNPETADKLNGVLASLEDLSNKLNNETVDSLNNTLTSWEDISRRLNKGQGSLGRLINDDETINQLNSALSNVNDYLGRADMFRTYLEYSGEYLGENNDTKSYLTVRIQPREDKYYLLGVVDDTAGVENVEEITTVTNGTATTRQVVTRVDENDIKFTAQIAKRFGNLTLRGGIFESTGGVGADYHFFRDRLALTFEAFDFDPDRDPHLKAKVEFSPIRHLFVLGGVDDFLSNRGRESYFIGAGIRFMDDDLKTIMANVPFPSN
ncbi:MAG: MlaD family protein [Pseudomonadota bacterium]